MSQERTEQPDYKAYYENLQREAGAVAYGHLQTIEQQRGEIDRLNATIAGLQAAIREQTAKVQERDVQIERLNKLEEADNKLIHTERAITLEMFERQDKEIERLRAALIEARYHLDGVAKIKDVGTASKKAGEACDQIDATLKGAE